MENLFRDNIRILARKQNWENLIALLICEFKNGQKSAIVKPENIILTKIEDHEANPSFYLTLQSAKILMDELWNCGIRPTKYDGNKGQLKSIEYHLEDMRKLTFDLFSKIVK